MHWLFERFASAPERIAFVHEQRQVTYREVLEKVRLFGDMLRIKAVDPGERVAVVGDFSPEVFCLMLALAENDNIIIPLSRDSVIEVASALGVSGCDWHAEFDAMNVGLTIERRPIRVPNALLDAFVAKRAPGMVFFSSGSTGKPKGILHDFNRVVSKFRMQRDAVVAIPFLMLDHFGGINTLLAITTSLGTVVTVADRGVASICAAIARCRVTLLPTTPSFLTLLMASGVYRDFDLTSLRRITYGTEVMPQATLDRLRTALPNVQLQQTYGLSEVGVLRSQSRDDGSPWMRIGGTGFQTRVVDDILWIKSDYAMVGYLNAPSEFDADGWFNTQDRVEVDGEYFRILGRVTDLINVGGQKVYPAEVEDVILALENIEDVSVYGEPHPMLGNIVVAKVAPIEAEDVQSIKSRIRTACRAKLAPYKVPSKVLLADRDFHTVRFKKVRRAQ
jgi:acyl-CoA synthetase (AMP-forming)/AMP-acid ligase II